MRPANVRRMSFRTPALIALLFGALAGGGVVRVSVDPESDRLCFRSEGRKAAAESAESPVKAPSER